MWDSFRGSEVVKLPALMHSHIPVTLQGHMRVMYGSKLILSGLLQRGKLALALKVTITATSLTRNIRDQYMDKKTTNATYIYGQADMYYYGHSVTGR